jgi:hypothetical protein
MLYATMRAGINKGGCMIVYNEEFQTYDVILGGIVVSSTWSIASAEATLARLME